MSNELSSQLCSHCQKTLPHSSVFFHRSARSPSGLHTVCKKCRNKQCVGINKKNSAKANENRRTAWSRLKIEVMTAYCGGTPSCACCGESHIEFLSLDHINEDGAHQRRSLGNSHSNKAVYRWARSNNYPATLQVLCHNCNRAKHIHGECPHERERREQTMFHPATG